jgi:hypothetical protein
VTKTRHTQPQQRRTFQPWIRERYVALREGAGPRWERTREVVVPVVVNTSHRFRRELVPAVAEASVRVADEAVQRSAPLRAEVSNRASATRAAVRGGVTARQIEHLQHSNQHRRKHWFLGGLLVVGAAFSTAAAVLWQRSRHRAWTDDDSTSNGTDSGEGASAASETRAKTASSGRTADVDAAKDWPQASRRSK